MKLFRGMSVSEDDLHNVLSAIQSSGIEFTEKANFQFSFADLREHLSMLSAKPDLSMKDTRGHSADLVDRWICACGDRYGASYYAMRHNRSTKKPFPILIEFEADAREIAVDGRDFLAKVFSVGFTEARVSMLERIYGPKVRWYVERAMATPRNRFAYYDLALFDSEIIEHHYASKEALSGGYGTRFMSAFFVRLPIVSTRIISVSTDVEFEEIAATYDIYNALKPTK